MNRSRPQTRQSRELEQARQTAQTRIVRVREQSMSAFSPRTEPRQRTGNGRDHAAALTVREQASVTDLNCPQAGRSLEQSASANSSWTGIVHKRGLTKKYPKGRIAVSILPPTTFPVQIQIIPTYARI